jgi:hypothetical protein
MYCGAMNGHPCRPLGLHAECGIHQSEDVAWKLLPRRRPEQSVERELRCVILYCGPTRVRTLLKRVVFCVELHDGCDRCFP